jgi:hypothetical protein
MRFKPLTVIQTALVFLGVMAGLAVIGIGAGVALTKGADVVDRPPPATAVQARAQTPPEPRLQVDRLADRQVVLGPERLASTWGWTDKAHGRAHIPVEDAMRLMAQRGWPHAEAGQ